MLDFVFIVAYVGLAVLALRALGAINSRSGSRASDRRADEASRVLQRLRRRNILVGGHAALIGLAVVDVMENVQLLFAIVDGRSIVPVRFTGIGFGPLLSLLKVPLAVSVLGALLWVAIDLASKNMPLRRTLISVRGVFYAVAGMYVLFMFGIGAAQIDDVIRDWDGWRAGYAVAACLLLSVIMVAVTRYLGGVARERPAPDYGRSAQPLVLGAAALLVLAGQLLRAFDRGWRRGPFCVRLNHREGSHSDRRDKKPTARQWPHGVTDSDG